MFQRRFVPILLLLIGVLIIGWQIAEHKRFKEVRKEQLIHRAQDITHTLAIVIRSQRFFGGVIFQPRLETALIDLVQSTGLTSIALFNAQGEIVCAAGEELKRDLSEFTQYGAKWEDDSVTIVNLVDLGIDPRRSEEQEPRTLIISEEERGILRKMRPRPPHRRERERGSPDTRVESNDKENGTVRSATEEARNEGKTRAQKMRERFGRPPGMDEGEYNTIIQKIGLHGFIIRMSTAHYRFANLYDLWLRASISGFAVIALLGFWFAWRNVIKSSDLQVRLVRANEMNTHLRQMNLAAAGLAHETKNPLNLVRGLAQV
ncbi:hypothetical protein GF373_00640, partial [bacterium]|nr:hypothetical protein [bacterium]